MRSEPIFKERRRNAILGIFGLFIAVWFITSIQIKNEDSVQELSDNDKSKIEL